MRVSLFKKIFISQLALLVFVSGAISLAGYFFMLRLHNESRDETLRLASSATAMKVAARIARHGALLKEIAEAGEAAPDLRKYQELFPVLLAADQEGKQEFRLVNGEAGEALDNLAGLEVFRAALAAPNQAILGDIVLEPGLQTQTVQFAYRRLDEAGGKPFSLLLGQTPLARVVDPADSNISLKNGYALVVASDGRILGGPEPGNIMKRLAVKNQDPGRLLARAAAEPAGQLQQARLNGVACHFAVTPIPHTTWLAMAVLPSRQYTAAPGLFRDFSLLLFAGLLLLAGSGTFFLARGISAPIRKLALAGADLGKGNLAQRFTAGNDETGELAEVLNAVAEELAAAASREKQLLAAEAAARRNAELADRHRREVLAGISHELRPPLQALLGMAETLENGERSGKPQPEIAALQEAGRNLLQRLDGLLDFARPEDGGATLAPAPFDLYAILGRLKKKSEPAARAKGLSLLYAEPTAVPTTVIGDEGRIFLILENLLDNAIKLTEHGEIVLRVRPLGLKAINGQHIIHLRFEVADTGDGSPPACPEAGRTGGIGTGLALSRQLVDLLHGKIGMKSEPGRGNVFFFELDLPVATEEAGGAAFETRAPADAHRGISGKQA